MKYNKEILHTRYQLIPRTLVFIRRENRYLLIHKRKKNSFGFEKLNGIGGHIEKAEEPYESALREIKEETGLIVKNLALAVIVFIDIGSVPGILMFVFSAEYESGNIIASEEGELLWKDKSAIEKEKNVVKDVPYLIELTENHLQGAPPKIIKYLYNDEGELRIVK